MNELLASIGWADLITQALVWIATAVILPKVWQYIKLSADDKTRGYMTTAFESAIKVGVNAYAKGQNKTASAVLLSVINDHEVRQQVITAAEDYMKHNVPAGLRRLKINGGLADIIVAKLDTVIETMAQTTAQSAKHLETVNNSPVPVERIAATTGNLGAPMSQPEAPASSQDQDDGQGKLGLGTVG